VLRAFLLLFGLGGLGAVLAWSVAFVAGLVPVAKRAAAQPFTVYRTDTVGAVETRLTCRMEPYAEHATAHTSSPHGSFDAFRRDVVTA
jgi:hypothetical protein